MKNIDNWLLHNRNFTQEERETILRFIDDYFTNKEIVVDDDFEEISPKYELVGNYFYQNIESIIRNTDWMEIKISRFRNDSEDNYEIEYITPEEFGSFDEWGEQLYFLRCWGDTKNI